MSTSRIDDAPSRLDPVFECEPGEARRVLAEKTFRSAIAFDVACALAAMAAL